MRGQDRPVLDDLERAKRGYEVALNQFDWATGKSAVDAAIYTLSAAELRLRAALERRRSLFCPNGLDKPANRGKEC